MQRKKSNNRNGRLANAEEKRFHAWLKEQSCCWCGSESGSIVDHARGSTFSVNKVHVGHMFCLCPCLDCDMKKTIHGKRQGNEAAKWEELVIRYLETVEGATCDEDIFYSIHYWGK